MLIISQDQWHKKKQTKEEARSAKRAKLDPANAKSAKDVMDENARKRKREAEDGSDVEALAGVEPEKPLEGFKRVTKKTKKQKKDEKESNHPKTTEQAESGDRAEKDAVTVQKAKAEKRRLKKEKKMAKAEAKAARKALKDEKKGIHEITNTVSAADEPSDEKETGTVNGDMDLIEMDENTQTSNYDRSPTATPSLGLDSPIFDAPLAQSGSSSISSIAQPTALEEANPGEQQQESKQASGTKNRSKEPKPIPEEFRARLEARINELRAARKADGLNGQPARTRQELMETRRLKEAERKAHKKRLRRQAKEEEDRKHAETLARGSPLLRGSPLYSPATGSNAVNSPAEPSNNFSFGRIAFGGHQQASAELDDIQNIRAPKGPSDPATALQAAEKRRAHLASLDDSKRADIEVKDMWLNAKKHAHGERVRDDTSLLKKTLKRKEKQKDKSKKEWTERLDGIKNSQDMKQKRREDNLQKRKEEKGGKKGKGKPKPKARPGFEGSFRARPGAGNKKK